MLKKYSRTIRSQAQFFHCHRQLNILKKKIHKRAAYTVSSHFLHIELEMDIFTWVPHLLVNV